MLLLATPLGAFAPTAAAAAACADYRAVAAADGARMAAESPGYLVVERTEVGSPVAQASVDSLGGSTAYAAYPDPGQEVLSVIPLAGVPRNAYPLVAESSYPASPEGGVETPAVSLTASSAARSSNAVAESGGASEGSSVGAIRATAAARCDKAGATTALAASTVDALSFGEGTLRIGPVHSTAKVVISPAGKPAVTSSLEIGHVAVAGQTVRITRDGLTVGDAPVGFPTDPVAQALAGAGIDVEYLAAQTQKDGRGVIAPGVRISVTRDVTGADPTVITFTVGRAFAAADLGGRRIEAPADEIGPLDDGVVAPTSSAPAAPAAATADSLNAPIGLSPGGEAKPRKVAVGVAVPARTSGLFSSTRIYAVVLAGGVVVLLGGLLFTRLGVRSAWT